MMGYSSRGQRILYEMPRHGVHGINARHLQRPPYVTDSPKEE